MSYTKESREGVIDRTPMPAHIPHVDELGVTSAPLKSAAFFIGEKCKEYNEDFMLCKAENRDPAHCLAEGRKVTRCAASLIAQMNKFCGKEYDSHWGCLEKNNQRLWDCRKPEAKLNSCVFDALGVKKIIPGTPEGYDQVHELKKPIFKPLLK